MARVHYSIFAGRQGKSRLPVKAIINRDEKGAPVQGTARMVLVCRRGDYIEKGEKYLWFAPGFRSAKRIGCMKHPPKASEMDTSLYQEVLAAQEDANSALNAITWSDGESAEDVQQAVEDAIQPVRDAIESVAEQYESAAEAMGGGAGAQFEEWASTLNDSDIMNWEATDYDDPPEPEWCEKHTDDMVDGDDQISPVDIEQNRADCSDCAVDLTDWTSDLVDEARDKVDSVSKE